MLKNSPINKYNRALVSVKNELRRGREDPVNLILLNYVKYLNSLQGTPYVLTAILKSDLHSKPFNF